MQVILQQKQLACHRLVQGSIGWLLFMLWSCKAQRADRTAESDAFVCADTTPCSPAPCTADIYVCCCPYPHNMALAF